MNLEPSSIKNIAPPNAHKRAQTVCGHANCTQTWQKIEDALEKLIAQAFDHVGLGHSEKVYQSALHTMLQDKGLDQLECTHCRCSATCENIAPVQRESNSTTTDSACYGFMRTDIVLQWKSRQLRNLRRKRKRVNIETAVEPTESLNDQAFGKVASKFVIELKATKSCLGSQDVFQTLAYQRSLRCERAMLCNFTQKNQHVTDMLKHGRKTFAFIDRSCAASGHHSAASLNLVDASKQIAILCVPQIVRLQLRFT